MVEQREVQPQQYPQEGLSVSNRMMLVHDLQPVCSCNRGEKVMYICVSADCPNIDKQPLYCVHCSHDEPSAHEHKGRVIAIETTSLHNQWITFRNDVGIKIARVITWLDNYSGLLDLLTSSTGNDTIIRSIRKLQEVEKSVS